MAYKIIEGELKGAQLKLAVVVGRFNSFVGEALLNASLDTLKQASVEQQNITIVRVPGAFEIPLMVKKLAQSGDYDGVIALGAIIRGGTPHFDFVANECARGLNDVQLDTGIPVGFGVLTVDTIEQAQERSRPDADNTVVHDAQKVEKHIVNNKGTETTVAVLEMISALAKVSV